MIPLWTVPLLLAALLAGLGWIGQRRVSRKHTGRIRRSWDIPDDVTAQDVKALYVAAHPITLTEAFGLAAESMRQFGEAMGGSGR